MEEEVKYCTDCKHVYYVHTEEAEENINNGYFCVRFSKRNLLNREPLELNLLCKDERYSTKDYCCGEKAKFFEQVY